MRNSPWLLSEEKTQSRVGRFRTAHAAAGSGGLIAASHMARKSKTLACESRILTANRGGWAHAWPLAPQYATNFEGQEMRVFRNAAVAATILGMIIAASSAQAALQTLTVNIDQYANAVDHTPGEILAIVTIADLAAGGVNVDVSLDKGIYFASTGGPHITFAFNLDKSISFNDLTFSNPSKSNFAFV